MIERHSHNPKLVSSVLCASRSRQKEPSVATEVRKVRQPRAGLRRLPSVPSCTDQPVAGTLRPQVQEGQEELQLQVKATHAVCFLLEYLKNLERRLVSPLLCIDSIYIFSLFIIGSSLNDFPGLSAGLSTFSGTTGNATCFPSTASPMAPRGSPTSTSPCMKKKVHWIGVPPAQVGVGWG